LDQRSPPAHINIARDPLIELSIRFAAARTNTGRHLVLMTFAPIYKAPALTMCRREPTRRKMLRGRLFGEGKVKR